MGLGKKNPKQQTNKKPRKKLNPKPPETTYFGSVSLSCYGGSICSIGEDTCYSGCRATGQINYELKYNCSSRINLALHFSVSHDVCILVTCVSYSESFLPRNLNSALHLRVPQFTFVTRMASGIACSTILLPVVSVYLIVSSAVIKLTML